MLTSFLYMDQNCSNFYCTNFNGFEKDGELGMKLCRYCNGSSDVFLCWRALTLLSKSTIEDSNFIFFNHYDQYLKNLHLLFTLTPFPDEMYNDYKKE